jgi:hypothetical protein
MQPEVHCRAGRSAGSFGVVAIHRSAFYSLSFAGGFVDGGFVCFFLALWTARIFYTGVQYGIGAVCSLSLGVSQHTRADFSHMSTPTIPLCISRFGKCGG